MRRTLGIILLLLPLAAAAQSPGGTLAEHWCMGCHVIEREPPGNTSAHDVPSFPAVATRPTTTADSLDRYMSSRHTRMPDFSLSLFERNALVAYILSLR